MLVLPLTETGRVTIYLLHLNDQRLVQLRYDDVLVKRHPPVDDPIEDE